MAKNLYRLRNTSTKIIEITDINGFPNVAALQTIELTQTILDLPLARSTQLIRHVAAGFAIISIREPGKIWREMSRPEAGAFIRSRKGKSTTGGGGTSGSGASGWSGFSGDSGFSGKSGWSGYSGPPGQSGYSGNSGASGQAGGSGTAGTSGYSGKSGASGASGQDGIIGSDGASGFSGYSGMSGSMGLSGYSGEPAPPVLGPAEDGSGYSDGLFTDFEELTPIGTAVDRINEVLKELAPQPAPNLSTTSGSQTGASARLSYDNSATISGTSSVEALGNLTDVNVDGDFTVGSLSGARRGVFGSSVTGFSGVLASGTTVGAGSPTPSYPANAFGDGSQGTLSLYVNDNTTPVHTVNLSSFANGSTVNGNGSGFNLSAATSVSFPNGSTFSVFQYRTGYWIAAGSDIREGWNFIKVVHTVGASTRTTNYIDFIRDSTTADATFSNASLVFTGSGDKTLSGVHWYTGGSVAYTIDIDGAYKNTYTHPNALSFSTVSTPLGTPSSQNLSGSGGNENKTENVSAAANVSANTRLIGGTVSLRTVLTRPVQGNDTSSTSSVSNILLDNFAQSSTVTVESFDDERYRLPSNTDFDDYTDCVISSWDTTQNIISGSTGYTAGLQVYNSRLQYPTINWGSATYTRNPVGASNPDYTGATGVRTYYRFFDMTPTAVANFFLTVNGTATIIAETTSFTNSTSQIKISMKLPNSGGEGTGWLDVTKAFVTAQWNDGDGCLTSAATPFAIGSSNKLSVGTKSTGSTSVSGKVLIRIQVPQGWTGFLTDVTLTGNTSP